MYHSFEDLGIPRPDAPWQDSMQVCLNGHVISDRIKKNPEDTKPFCDECGEKTIAACPKCNEPIPGVKHQSRVTIAYQLQAPNNCHNCGAAFPWNENEKEQRSAVEEEKPIQKLQQVFSNFHSIARRLRNRYDNRDTLDVSDEYDVQDLLSALLILHFHDIRPEEWTPSYAGKSGRMDFLLKDVKIVVETKMTRQTLSEKKIGDELTLDIAQYKQHPDCDTLVCFIYDPEGHIVNPQGLKVDLECQSTENLKVVVFIFPS